jgi:hypothetical protein
MQQTLVKVHSALVLRPSCVPDIKEHSALVLRPSCVPDIKEHSAVVLRPSCVPDKVGANKKKSVNQKRYSHLK